MRSQQAAAPLVLVVVALGLCPRPLAGQRPGRPPPAADVGLGFVVPWVLFRGFMQQEAFTLEYH